MGINSSIGTLLVRARQRGTQFGEVLTIGRQSLRILPSELHAMAKRLGVGGTDWSESASDGFAEQFLRRLLGAQSVLSMDYSAYEQADIVHDLNQPILTDLHRTFDVVIDSGSLEHIFDIRQALANYMNMVKIGGHIFVATPANNYCGHGFYQFSPELFCRVFQNANGFVINELIIIERYWFGVNDSRYCRFYRVIDPAEVGQRVQFTNKSKAMIFLDATRISDVVPFAESPLQSDYQHKWQSSGPRAAPARPLASRGIPYRLLRRLRRLRKSSLRNRRFFEPLDPASEPG